MLKTQIVDAGQRLWQREYVAENGGNISARITNELILCTPTLCGKGQLQEQDWSIVDLENRQIFGGVTPQGNLIPEQEGFVGPVPLSPYETPGTREFAETVLLLFVNTIAKPL